MANLKQIEEHLRAKKLRYEVIDLGGEVFTVEGVSKAGVDEDEIVKTLIVRVNGNPSISGISGSIRFAALAVRGKDRLDFKKIRKLFGSKSGFAKAEEVLKVCKVPIGAVCPILLGIPLIFDRKVMDLKRVHMGSGDLTRGLEMDFKDLLRAVDKYQVEDLV